MKNGFEVSKSMVMANASLPICHEQPPVSSRYGQLGIPADDRNLGGRQLITDNYYKSRRAILDVPSVVQQ
jgi:hypothetical protein